MPESTATISQGNETEILVMNTDGRFSPLLLASSHFSRIHRHQVIRIEWNPIPFEVPDPVIVNHASPRITFLNPRH